MAGAQNAGIGRSIDELIKNLIKLDTENEYYLFLTKENFDKIQIQQDGNWRKILVNARWYTVKEQVVVAREIKKIGPDLIYFPHFNIPLFYRGKFIITIHDLIWIKYPRPRKEVSTLNPLLYWIKNFFSKIIFRLAIKRAQAIITPTEFTKREIIDFYKIESTKIKVINWGINASFKQKQIVSTEKKSDNILEKCYNIRKPYFLYVGSAYPHKNLVFLLEVFKNINTKQNIDCRWLHLENPAYNWRGSDFQLVLTGGESYFYKKLKQKVKELNIEDNVIFTGYVNDEDLGLLYKNAFLFIFPSLIEGFGFPPLEAMGCGTPVISSNSSCLPEILGDAVFYFDPTERKALEREILSVINNQHLRDKLIKKGIEQVKKYNWQSCAKKYIEVIKL